MNKTMKTNQNNLLIQLKNYSLKFMIIKNKNKLNKIIKSKKIMNTEVNQQ